MRTGMILAVVAACALATACTKKNSLYLEPGRPAGASEPAAHKPQGPPPPSMQKASDVTPMRS